MSRWVLYPLILVGCLLLLGVAWTVGDIANRDARVLLEPGLALPTLVLFGLWAGLVLRKWPFPGVARGYGLLAGLLVMLTLVYQVNRNWVVEEGIRTVEVLDKRLASRWGGRQNREPVCVVTVEHWKSSSRKVHAVAGCRLHSVIQPGRSRVRVRSELGITGVEFAEVLGLE